MSHSIILFLALVFFFVVTFLTTWAIREGGSFAFLRPSRWRRRPAGTTPEPEDRRP